MRTVAAALIVLGAALCPPACAAAMPVVPRYELSVVVRPSAIDVNGTVTFAQRSAAKALVLNDRMRDLTVAEVVAGGETPLAVTADAPRSGRITWHVGLTDAPDGPVTLHVRYTGGGEPRLVYSLGTRVAFAAGGDSPWYPQAADESRGVGTMTFHVAPGTVVAATGIETDTDADRAAGTFAFRDDVPASLSFSAAPYIVVRGTGPLAVAGYFLKPRANAADYLARCVRVVAFLERQFGPLPYGRFGIVEVPDDQAGAAGFSGASVEGFIFADSSSLDAPFSTAFYGHEISHQWWGNLVRLAGRPGTQMVDEAMAQYGSLQTVRALEGEDAARRYRITGYPGYNASQSARGYFELAAAGLDRPLQSLDGAPGLVGHNLADSKGFLTLDLLAQSVGRARFTANLMRLTREHAFGSLTWPQFVRAVTEGASFDAGEFSREWFERTGAPSFTLHWRRAPGGVTGTIAQDGPAYRVRLPVVVRFADGTSVTRAVAVDGSRTAFTLRSRRPVTAVDVDPDMTVLHWTAALRERALALARVTDASYAVSAGENERARGLLETAVDSAPSPDPYGVRFRAASLLARLAQQRGDVAEAKRRIDDALTAPARDPLLLPYAYLRLAQIDAKLGDANGARAAAAAALDADRAIHNAAGVASSVEALLATLPH